ncbi:MAG: hypothetical protein LQ337_007658 [Flavoplaca oasis]|nr:MAG: hypothetical protein LQ337_007658 [Flavoplaca oasis]
MNPQSTDGLVITNRQSRRGSGLPNQGQIDWVALANTTVSASVGVLSRLSGAGVDPFTVAVGQAVASKFRMSRLGIHRLETAVKNLRYTSMIGDALWFGFGINHIIRILMQTTEGATCLMLCSVLSESRRSVLSARVLFELTTTYSSSSPDATRLTPSLQQWKALVKACAGTLSATPFGTVVDQMVMLVSQHRTSNPGNGHCRHVGDPESVAAVLNALGRLSTGHLITLTISGGCDCGWIAAVAYWFFDIAVEIRDIDGQVLYPLDNRPDASGRTLVVVQALERSTALQATSEAYTVADITKDILARDQASGDLTFNINDLQTRVSWQSVLRQTFGKQASALLRLKVDLGTAVGSAARIFLEYAKPQLDESLSWPLAWFRHGAASYGQEFLHLICMTFPEMASLRDIMEIASQKSYPDAVSAYQLSHERLRSTCECKRCGRQGRRLTPGVRGQNLCLSILCGFVIQLALDLSVTSVPPSLLPTRSGLEILFRRYLDDYFRCSKEDPPLVPNAFEQAWAQTSVLFTGYEEITSLRFAERETLAFVKGGLCSYLGVLAKLSDKPEEMHHTFIIPGCIETKTGRMYDKLKGTRRFKVPDFTYDASPAVPCIEIPTMLRSPQDVYEINPVVEETMISLTSHFIVKKSSGMSVVCSPWLLVLKLLEATCGHNRILCSRQKCPKLDITGLSVATIRGEGQFKDKSLRKANCRIGLRLVGDSPISRLLALLVDDTYGEDVPPEAVSRSRRGRRDHWQYGPPDVSPTHSGSDGSAQDSLEDDEPHVGDEVDEGSSSPSTPYTRAPNVILQRDECLPCAIRKAVTITGEESHNAYIICRGRQGG